MKQAGRQPQAAERGSQLITSKETETLTIQTQGTEFYCRLTGGEFSPSVSR